MVRFQNHILLDGARMEQSLETAKKLNPIFDSLYRGRSEEELDAVAPYLFSFPPNSDFSTWIFENGWGSSWGLIVSTKINFEDCWKHFRKFLIIKTEEGQELYFRFYDPRVLKVFLPTCDEQQIMEFFGPIEKFIVEGDNKESAIEFTHQNGIVKQQSIAASAVFGELVQQ